MEMTRSLATRGDRDYPVGAFVEVLTDQARQQLARPVTTGSSSRLSTTLTTAIASWANASTRTVRAPESS